MSADIQPITSLKLVDIRRKENEIRVGIIRLDSPEK